MVCTFVIVLTICRGCIKEQSHHEMDIVEFRSHAWGDVEGGFMLNSPSFATR
jgi:hypothetical protein